MIPLLIQFLKRKMKHFLTMLSLERNKVRDIVFEKESVSIPTTDFDNVQASISVIVREADMESQQDNVE